ncbi:hypothetical protein RSOLAG1IB_11693 [Rhizoctonia solani AG-1 IB]|nr:hypothetical protein RSOLAG1IB_11693 [Rhizoctonia solani AG-1 IB]
MESRLFKNAHQDSICLRMQELAAEELGQPMEINESDEEGTQGLTPRSSTPLPAEYNDHGVLTARAKGKGRA